MNLPDPQTCTIHPDRRNHLKPSLWLPSRRKADRRERRTRCRVGRKPREVRKGRNVGREERRNRASSSRSGRTSTPRRLLACPMKLLGVAGGVGWRGGPHRVWLAQGETRGCGTSEPPTRVASRTTARASRVDRFEAPRKQESRGFFDSSFDLLPRQTRSFLSHLRHCRCREARARTRSRNRRCFESEEKDAFA